jgi:hypothetical protein
VFGCGAAALRYLNERPVPAAASGWMSVDFWRRIGHSHPILILKEK